MTYSAVPSISLLWLSTAHPPRTSFSASQREQKSERLDFNCAEQFMMYCKALFFHYPTSHHLILQSKDPAKQKAMGRRSRGETRTCGGVCVKELRLRGIGGNSAETRLGGMCC